MASITTRAGKGTPLTNLEVDANFTNLNTELLSKQDTLVSGTSIKTVNGQSVLGSGNIQIDGGVVSFNTRTGAVSLTSGDVTTALGYTPLNKAGDTITGNVGFSGSGIRITGDFSNAAHSSRVLLQSSTTNGNSQLGIIPNGTAVNAGYFAYNSSDLSNASTAVMRINAGNVAFISGIVGSGSYLPMVFLTNNLERAQISVAGNLLVGTGTDNGSDRVQVDGYTNTSLKVKIYRDLVVSVTANTATTTLDLSLGNTFVVTIAANTTFAFSNVPSGTDVTAITIITVNDATAGRAISWPASVAWAGGQTPTRTTAANKEDVYTLFTRNAGTKFIGSLAIANV